MTRVGIIGGGQLGRMIALAGYPFGLRFRILDPAADSPAAQLADSITGSYDNPDALKRFADGLDVVTYEFENVPVTALDALQAVAPIYPPREALAISQDRLFEKQFFQKLGIPTTKFAGVSSRAELEAAIAYLGLPAVLKTRRFGYDGKGQQVLRSPDEAAAAWEQVKGNPCILEEMIPFDEEVSIVAARRKNGDVAVYPLAHNTHRDGILRVSWADPAIEGDELTSAARKAIDALLSELDYVGVLALELFVRRGQIIANEIAPRVHNSGHWTIEGAPSSQFENHLRAIIDLPLGETHGDRPCAMVNLIGALPDIGAVLEAIPDAHIHYYGKEPRPGRKVGHITVLAPTLDELHEKTKAVCSSIGEES